MDNNKIELSAAFKAYVCYLFPIRNFWEHCTAQILLLHEDTCLLFRSRKYGSRVTKPYLLAQHVADPVPQLSQQRQSLIHVAFSVLELMASYKYPQGVGWTAPLQSSCHRPRSPPRRMGHPWPKDAVLQHLDVCTSYHTHSSQLSCHHSSLVITCQQWRITTSLQTSLPFILFQEHLA